MASGFYASERTLRGDEIRVGDILPEKGNGVDPFIVSKVVREAAVVTCYGRVNGYREVCHFGRLSFQTVRPFCESLLDRITD